LGLLGLFVAGMAIGNIAGRPFEIIGILIVWVIYTLWVISPLLIVRDIVSIWYKIPFLVMTIISILRVLVGIYFGTNTKITPLKITNTHLSNDRKIVFISDIHVEAIHNTKYIQSIVNKIKKLKPDFVLLGGDLMNTAKSDYVDAFLPFNQLEMPVYATLGNHDNMGESNAISGIFDTTKIIPLRNQSVNISGIQIVGIDDKSYWK
jgi:predicted MPP superfamily phosphohydrolase